MWCDFILWITTVSFPIGKEIGALLKDMDMIKSTSESPGIKCNSDREIATFLKTMRRKNRGWEYHLGEGSKELGPKLLKEVNAWVMMRLVLGMNNYLEAELSAAARREDHIRTE